MDEDKKPSPQDVTSPQINTGNTNPDSHPLHMLYNQADPYKRPKVILQKPIRTYESDMAELLAKKDTSVATIAIAEQKRKNPTPPPQVHEPIHVPIPKPEPVIPTQPKPAPIPTPEPEASIVIKPAPLAKQKPTVFVPKETKTVAVEDAEPPSRFTRKLFMFLLSLIFIASGLGTGYYFYMKSPVSKLPVIQTVKSKVPSIITPNIQKIVPIASLKNELLGQKIQSLSSSTEMTKDSITEFIFTKNTASTTARVISVDFINLLGYSAPEMLKRSLVDSWMFGVYGNDNENTPFIILKTDFFQNAFAGTLKWEPAMPEELATILNYRDKIRAENNLSSSTIASYFAVKGKFVDRVILNRDVREFITEAKNTLLVYSFIDKDTLLITTSESTMRNLIQRLEKQPQVR